MLGKSIPSYELFTGKNPQVVLGISYEHKNTDETVAWQTILNHPTTGIGLFYTNYGTKIKGQSLSLVPFVEFYYKKLGYLNLLFYFCFKNIDK